MKSFFKSFLGAMAAIWVSLLILTVGSIFAIGFLAAKAALNDSPAEVKDKSVLVLDLNCAIVDRETPRDIFKEITDRGEETLSLTSIIGALKEGAEDPKITGLYIKCNGASMGMAQANAILSAIEKFKNAGKWVAAYSDNYSQADYIIASTADSLYLNPSGAVDLHGLQATTLYFKDMLDKIGVEAQVVKVGTYKSAVEPFMLNEMSEASRLQQEVYMGNIWSYLAAKVAKNRNLTSVNINDIADSIPAFLPAKTLVDMHLIDRLVYEREVDPILYVMAGNEIDDADDDQPAPEYISIADYAGTLDLDAYDGGGDKTIAVLYAIGDITEAGDEGIVSQSLVPQILDLADDDDIDALVLRVNSGGGSAFASEQIWDALKTFKERTGKPFYVSMGDYAASGGYYISCGADKIYADPVTLTGSIGIFGIIPSAQGLMNDKLGVHTGTVATNPKGELPTLMQNMTPRQREALQRNVDRGYELFTSRVAEGRKIPVDSVKAIAEGRVWDGQSALKIGLVDELGDLENTLAAVAKELGVESYKIATYPDVERKWWEQIVDLDKKIQERAIATRIPYALPLYNTIESLGNISPLQCRMDYIIIQ